MNGAPRFVTGVTWAPSSAYTDREEARLPLHPYIAGLIGGLLIGLSATLLLLYRSRIAGISGIVASTVSGVMPDLWRVAFLVGLVGTGTVAFWWAPEAFDNTLDRSPVALVAAGLLVGFGTRLGNGCTSGHGVCGLSRQSSRSAVAVVVFIFVGIVTASLVRVAFGGVV